MENSPSEKDVLAALGRINDPNLRKDIVSLGYVRDLKLDRGSVRFTLTLPIPLFPNSEKMREESRRVVVLSLIHI